MNAMTKEEAIDFIRTEHYMEWEAYSKIYNLSKVQMPTCEIINKAKGVAGTAYYQHIKLIDKKPVLFPASIEYNLPYVMQQGAAYKEVISHELAHIICHHLYPNAKQAHGSEFRMILQSAGYKGSTYHNFNVKEAKNLARATKLSVIDTLTDEELAEF